MSFSTMLSSMGVGMLRTCLIFILTLLISLPLGMIVMLIRRPGPLPEVPRGEGTLKTLAVRLWRGFLIVLRLVMKIYIAVMRGTPLMLQLLAWYFGPYYLFGMSIRGYRFPAIIIGFSMNYAAYFAEIFRGGIEAIPKGQYEAAEILGYGKTQTFFRIILPQVIKTILPSVTNEVITLVKDTSMAFTLAYNEMFSLAKQIAASQTSFMPFVIAGVFYFIANYVVAFVMEFIEKKLSYYR